VLKPYNKRVILTRAPLRISLAGGGSDLPAFYRQDFGEVISLTINKYVYVAVHSFFAGGIRLSYSKTELVSRFEEIQHPIFRNAMKILDFREDVEISSFADVPGNGTGLGSSSAFTVALLKCLLDYRKLTSRSEEIADLACRVELELCGDPIGKQDQYASAVGGIRNYVFNRDDSVIVKEDSCVASKEAFLNECLILYYLGIGRSALPILREQSLSMKSSADLYDSVRNIRGNVKEMISCIRGEDAFGVGQLILNSWNEKKKLSKQISNSVIEDCLSKAIKLGATGGKVVGAGGGGFLLICVPPEIREKFIESYDNLKIFPFKVSNTGVETIYNNEVDL
jgi:D-glycero-alpha-D-manno-heptose-7-phosphate kinase